MVVYSYSRLKKFEHCPRAYELKYIQRVEAEEVRNIYGFLGSTVHKTLEMLHEDLKNGRSYSLDRLLNLYGRLWDKRWSDEIQISDERYSSDHFRQVGRECIENYYKNHEPFEERKTVDTELQIYPEVSSGDQEYTFMGYIDRLALNSDDEYEVHDYKTSKNLPTKEKLENDTQLALYQLGVHQEYPDAEDVKLVWHFLRFGKDFRVEWSREDLEELQERLVEKIQRIENAKEESHFPTKRNRGARCDWCDYKRHCPEWNHLYETEKLPENEFLEENGVELVDKLADVERKLDNLKEKKSDLEEKESKLKEAIIEYAEENHLSTVFGTEKKASVEVKEKGAFPRKGQEGREELEDLIKDSGKWGDVSYLSLRSLEGIYRENEWASDLIEDIDDFRNLEECEEVNLEDLDE